MYAENPKQFNKTYRIQIAHTEQEIDTIIWMGVFCGDKTGFVRPGHIYTFCYTYMVRVSIYIPTPLPGEYIYIPNLPCTCICQNKYQLAPLKHDIIIVRI